LLLLKIYCFILKGPGWTLGPFLLVQCPSIHGLFVQSLRYAQKIILGISAICLWLFFSHALILNKNPNLWMDTILNTNYLTSQLFKENH
jgi:hypothetical protein